MLKEKCNHKVRQRKKNQSEVWNNFCKASFPEKIPKKIYAFRISNKVTNLSRDFFVLYITTMSLRSRSKSGRSNPSGQRRRLSRRTGSLWDFGKERLAMTLLWLWNILRVLSLRAERSNPTRQQWRLSRCTGSLWTSAKNASR